MHIRFPKAVMGAVATAAVGVAVLAGAGSSQAAVTPPNAKDLTIGKWELNLAKSKFCGPAPQKSARNIYEAGWGLVVTEQTGINAQGKPTKGGYVARYDGEKYPANMAPDSREAIIWKLVNPHRLEFTHWNKQDKITATYVRVVSDDGQTMTQTGKAVSRPNCDEVQVFERQATH
jgi:hypothetical protein